MVFVLLYLSISHIIRMITNYGGYDMDISTYTMMLTAKLSSLAFCYSDGGKDDKDLLPEQKVRKVKDMPSVLELFSYVYFCEGCIVGPFFEYSDYKRFIEMKGEYEKIPNSFWLSIRSFLIAHCIYFLVTNIILQCVQEYISL